MHDYYVSFVCFLFYILGIGELRDMWGGQGPYEFPTSHDWPCLVDNKLFSKSREFHSFIFILKDHSQTHSIDHLILSSFCFNFLIGRIWKETTIKRHCTRARLHHGKQWLVNGANIEFFSKCLCMHRNLTWIDCLYALMIWEGL